MEQGLDPEGGRRTRVLAMGRASFTDGFSLLGIEVYPEATQAQMEQVLSSILEGDEEALVILEHHLARCDCPLLDRCRTECSRVVVVEVPSLSSPDDYHPRVEAMVQKILGAQALEME